MCFENEDVSNRKWTHFYYYWEVQQVEIIYTLYNLYVDSFIYYKKKNRFGLDLENAQSWKITFFFIKVEKG